MLDALFVNVHRNLGNISYGWQSCLGLMSMAAFLEKNGYDCKVMNCNYYEFKNMLLNESEFLKCKLIGFYCDFDNVLEVKNLSSWIKNEWQIPVIVGGPQSMHLDVQFFLESKCDVVVRGEGELTIVEIVSYYLDNTGDLMSIKGISYLNQDNMIVNEDREAIENLDLLPICDEKYILKADDNLRFWVCMTGRGCPFNCSFCFEAIQTKKVRFRSVENVLKELALKFSPKSNFDYLMFADDTFTLNTDRLQKLCDGIKILRENKDFVWFCEGHVKTLLKHPEMIDYMVDSGMVRLQLGIESGNSNVLVAYNKGCTPEDIIQLIKICKDKGVTSVYGNIILGSAFFSKETYEQDLKFAEELIRLGKGMVELAVVYYWPLAGTKMTNYPTQFGIVIEDKDFVTAMMDLPQTSTKEFDLWSIQSMGYKFKQHLNNVVLGMVKNNDINRDTILNWYKIRRKYKTGISLWLELIKCYGEMDRYYELTASGDAEFGENLSVSEILTKHPMRLISLIDQFDGEKIKNILYEELVLDTLDMEILRYSFCKLKTTEIIERICKNYNNYDLHNLIITKLLDLEKHYLIAFGKF